MNFIRVALCAYLFLSTVGCEPAATDSAIAPPSTASLPESSADNGPKGRQVLATGAAISGANGVHFGPDGLLYVASVIGSEIVVLDPETGNVMRRISEGVEGPDDIAFHSDGSFYWTSILTGEVAGIRPDGSRVTVARLTPGSNPITFSSDDRLFVSQCFFDDKLYEVDPEGREEPRLISDSLGPNCGLNGMDWGPDDRLYGPRWFRGEIVSFDVDTLEMRTEATGFEVPAAVKFDSNGVLHVLDTASGAVVRVDAGEREVIARFPPGLDNFAFDADDRLFVSSFVDGFVIRVNTDGSQTTISPGGLAHPGGLALRETSGDEGQPRLEIVIADLQSIRGFDASTGASTFVERNVFGVSEMGSVTNIAIDGENLLLTSWLDGSVKVWDPNERKVLESHTELAGPVSALRYAGKLVVAEHGKGRVISIGASSGELQSHHIEVIATGLPAPTGLAVRGGDLFVGDRERGEIIRIATDGVPREAAEVVVTGLSTPEGIAATEKGFAVMEGASGRLVEVDASGVARHIATIDAGTSSPTEEQPPSMVFNGVAVGDAGVVFVTGETSRALYRVELR
jgi:sugar lactone lactonase YvrE